MTQISTSIHKLFEPSKLFHLCCISVIAIPLFLINSCERGRYWVPGGSGQFDKIKSCYELETIVAHTGWPTTIGAWEHEIPCSVGVPESNGVLYRRTPYWTGGHDPAVESFITGNKNARLRYFSYMAVAVNLVVISFMMCATWQLADTIYSQLSRRQFSLRVLFLFVFLVGLGFFALSYETHVKSQVTAPTCWYEVYVWFGTNSLYDSLRANSLVIVVPILIGWFALISFGMTAALGAAKRIGTRKQVASIARNSTVSTSAD